MARRILVAMLLGSIAACGPNPSAPNEDRAPAAPTVDTSRLLGLYESGPQAQRNQLCMIGDAPDAASFGITTWGANLASCSGSGQASREGGILRLEMAGDQACTIEARIEGGKIALPAQVPASCAYYCGNGATLSGTAFDKTGHTRDDALKATDLVGEPLCAGLR